jgi:hypothetical protein
MVIALVAPCVAPIPYKFKYHGMSELSCWKCFEHTKLLSSLNLKSKSENCTFRPNPGRLQWSRKRKGHGEQLHFTAYRLTEAYEKSRNDAHIFVGN